MLHMKNQHVIFSKVNYAILVAGVIILITGFFMMGINTGSVSHDIYSFTRITLSPVMIIAGYGMLILSIFKK
jgi:hypothetical protein